MSESVLLADRRDHVLVLTMNRPDSLNAINGALAEALHEALVAAESDPEVRAIVLTGAGKAFCAGMDLKEFSAGGLGSATIHPDSGFAGVVRRAGSKPVVAAVNGFAFGGGAEIMLSADLVVIDSNAQLAFPEVARGLVAAAGGVVRLPQQLPPRIAAELILTGRGFGAEEALAWGLSNATAPPGTSLDVALELAQRVAANAPLAVQASTRLLRWAEGRNAWDDETWVRNDEVISPVFASGDAKEGALAFVEKRAPQWSAS